jgi:superfamily II DNA or RNA helicase
MPSSSAVRPRVLLGLTATPERSDGQADPGYFDAGRMAAPAVELRLWHALDLQLLAPSSTTPATTPRISHRAVAQAGEREAVDKLVTGNDVRAGWW